MKLLKWELNVMFGGRSLWLLNILFIAFHRKENPVKEANKPDKIVLEDSRKETEEEEEEDYDDDGGGGGDGIVGAAAVVIHEKPVVLQAPVIGRPFMTQAPYFLKTVVGQHPNKPSSSQTSQLQRPQKNSNPCKNQVYQSLEVTPTEKEIADQKSGTLRLGEFCFSNMQLNCTCAEEYAYVCCHFALGRMNDF